ncbi:MAG TPA: DUF1778 domain-containing protein [Gemmataceae bacterium]|nr:DUF1778 domain-containing protein [Gemmataceae bacterium]
MAKRPSRSSAGKATSSRSLVVRLDEESKLFLTRAAELRHISVSDYVRAVTIAQARREVRDAEQQIITLSPEAQLAFWNALNEPVHLTEAQKQLGALMRGLS